MNDCSYSVYFQQYYSAEYEYTIRPTIRSEQNTKRILNTALIATFVVNKHIYLIES